MDESPAAALRRKPGASIRVAAELVQRGEASALVSAGHTGASVVAAHAVFGMLPGVDRPALAPAIPTRTGMAVLLDAGATVECRPPYLLQFGVLGAVTPSAARRCRASTCSRLARKRAGQRPRGAGSGGAHQLPATRGRAADVIVCDGFTGNVALKLSEGLVETVEELLGAELSSTFSSQVGYLLSRRAFRRFRKRLDYSEYGGAPLLGVSGLVFVCHGRSSVKAIRNAVVAAARFAADDILGRMAERVTTQLMGDR
jgi:glycerol-3-phosphate acyltransferase PlsX